MKKIIILLTIIFSISICKNADVISNKTQERISGTSADFGKPTAPVRLKWESPKSTPMGQTATIQYSATPSVNGEKLTLIIRLPENVSYVSGDKEISVTNKNAGETVSGTILIKSNTEAMHFINIEALIKSNGKEQAANTNIQFQVGEAANFKKATSTETSGEKFLDIKAK